LLDICGSSDDGTPQPATMPGMEIETLNRLRWSQHNTQLQLCVPLVTTKGESHRLAEAIAGTGVVALS
jgi:hypothetical protein